MVVGQPILAAAGYQPAKSAEMSLGAADRVSAPQLPAQTLKQPGKLKFVRAILAAPFEQ